MVSKRYAKANNPLAPDYDASKLNSYIMYLDANNLYGSAMSKPLPKSGFKWKRVMPTEEEILNKKENAKNGWILEVDLEYPAELHEECGTPIEECVCLRPKMYCIMKADEKNIKKAKGVKRSVVKKQIKHEQYKETLFGTEQLWQGMNILRSEGHEIYGMHVNKISLSPFDSKRWIADDGINTNAYGYTRPLFTNTEMKEIEALLTNAEIKEIEALTEMLK